MLTWGVTLVIVGTVAIAASILLGLINMGVAARGKTPVEVWFTCHIAAMVGMAVSGLVTAVGVIIVIIHFAQTYLPAAFE